ncbi:MAG: hypothetical protein BRD44_06600 [Bacteroidetes bacterium QS_7_67_15]|nr:MAG: hypothetical protein BRD44_06600 [Bacteroidetes bacterium QS_7_67_15]
MKASSTSFAFFALLCSGLLLAACDSASDAQKPQLRIASQQTSSAAVGDSATTASGDTVVYRGVDPSDEIYENPPPVAVDVADDGRLHIGGFFFAFTLSAKLEGEIDRGDNTVQIDIRAVAPESYPRMPRLFFYDAYVTDLPPGTYELRVTHEGDIFQNDKKERVTTMVQKTIEVQ